YRTIEIDFRAGCGSLLYDRRQAVLAGVFFLHVGKGEGQFVARARWAIGRPGFQIHPMSVTGHSLNSNLADGAQGPQADILASDCNDVRWKRVLGVVEDKRQRCKSGKQTKALQTYQGAWRHRFARRGIDPTTAF